MKRIEAKIVADSISPQGHRITSMLITFPRFILAEGKTHRIISGLHGEVEVLEDISINSFREGSKNSASSRAIPFEKMVKMVEEDPFIPIAWQKDHKGMQGTEYIKTTDGLYVVERYWLEARDRAVKAARDLASCNITKQLCNRILEPFMWHTVLVTATEWENFFGLRCPKYYFEPSNKCFRSRKDFVKEWNGTFKVGLDVSREVNMDSWTFEEWQEKFNHSQAEIHIQVLAESMWDAMNESTPRKLKAGEWHIPFGDQMDEDLIVEVNRRTNTGDYFDAQTKIKIATARCARLSYMTHDGEINYEKDIKLHNKLLKDKHPSPFEHCSKAMNEDEYYLFSKGMDGQKSHEHGWCNNFRGWIQYRYLVENGL